MKKSLIFACTYNVHYGTINYTNYGRTGGKYLASKTTDYLPVICLWNRRPLKVLNDSTSFPNKFYSINKNWDRNFCTIHATGSINCYRVSSLGI